MKNATPTQKNAAQYAARKLREVKASFETKQHIQDGLYGSEEPKDYRDLEPYKSQCRMVAAFVASKGATTLAAIVRAFPSVRADVESIIRTLEAGDEVEAYQCGAFTGVRVLPEEERELRKRRRRVIWNGAVVKEG